MTTQYEYRELTVRSGERGKGRSFRAVVLAYGAAAVWDKHQCDSQRIRPVFLMLACQAQEAGPVLANMRLGNTATMTGDGLGQGGVDVETLKSVRYQWASQRLPLGYDPGMRGSDPLLGSAVVLTGRVPRVLQVDPGIVPEGEPVRFLIAPPRARLEAELARLPAAEMRRYGEGCIGDAFRRPENDWEKPRLTREDEEWRLMPAMALWFCAALDRRTTLPILPDPLFQVRVYLAALREGLASWGKTGNSYGWQREFGRGGTALTEWGYAGVGLAPGVACSVSQDALRLFLVEEVRGWVAEGERARARASSAA